MHNSNICVIGLAIYSQIWKNVSLFVRSIRKNSSFVRIVLITNSLTNYDKIMFHKFNVEFVELNFEKLEKTSEWKHYAFIRRYELYLNAIKTKKINQSYIFLSDTRDVLVLDDLHKLKNIKNLIFSQENSSFSFENELFNKNWFRNVYGQKKLELFEKEKILCAGVIFGSKFKIIDYIFKMIKEIKKIKKEVLQKNGDQPIHNFVSKKIIYTTSSAENGPIRSVAILPQKIINNFFNNSPIIIHQYDRHLKSFFIKKNINLIFKKYL